MPGCWASQATLLSLRPYTLHLYRQFGQSRTPRSTRTLKSVFPNGEDAGMSTITRQEGEEALLRSGYLLESRVEKLLWDQGYAAEANFS
jgi:hypothetical protein